MDTAGQVRFAMPVHGDVQYLGGSVPFRNFSVAEINGKYQIDPLDTQIPCENRCLGFFRVRGSVSRSHFHGNPPYAEILEAIPTGERSKVTRIREHQNLLVGQDAGVVAVINPMGTLFVYEGDHGATSYTLNDDGKIMINGQET